MGPNHGIQVVDHGYGGCSKGSLIVQMGNNASGEEVEGGTPKPVKGPL